ncbi:MAG: hypothetical protein GXO77_07390 [Calditrichaeota bacterium]|nr:hypothetical protein [Calditrichota bacterium]
MMTKLREFSKFFIILVAAAFIALMVFEWGANYSTQSRKRDTVGEVNGQKLTYSEFNELFQQLYREESARTGKTNFTDDDMQKLRDQVWERFVQQTLFQEEMKHLGIAVSDSEVVYQIFNYPLEDFKKHPAFQTDGVFDIKKYRAALGNPNIPWKQIEQIYREQIPYVKLQNIITNTVRVSEEEIRDEFEKNNIKMKVEYLGASTFQFLSDSIKVNDEEIKDYYKTHKDEFVQEERRQLAYVKFQIKTTKEDTMRVLKEFDSIKQRLANGENFNDLALEYSEDPSVKNNKGELGYFARGDMVKPFEEAAFNAKVGDIVGPIQTAYGYHLIKVEDKKKENGKLKVKVSHILMKVHPAPSHVESVETNARLFSEDAKNHGFMEQAKMNGYEVNTTPLFTEEGDFVPGIGNHAAIKAFAFAAELNEVSNFYRIDNGYIVVSVTKIEPKGYRPLEAVKQVIENRIRLDKARELARKYIHQFDDKIKAGEEFEKIAQSDPSKKLRYDVTGMFSLASTVPGIGYSVEFNATAFALKPGEISDLVETDRGFYYLKLLEKTKFDSAAFNAQKESIKNRLLNEKRSQIFTNWYEQLKEKADIVDNRRMFNL